MYFSLFWELVGDVGTQHKIRDRLISVLLNPFWLRCLYAPALCWLRLFVCYFEVSILYLNAMSKQEHSHHTKNYNAGKLKNNSKANLTHRVWSQSPSNHQKVQLLWNFVIRKYLERKTRESKLKLVAYLHWPWGHIKSCTIKTVPLSIVCWKLWQTWIKNRNKKPIKSSFFFGNHWELSPWSFTHVFKKVETTTKWNCIQKLFIFER